MLGVAHRIAASGVKVDWLPRKGIFRWILAWTEFGRESVGLERVRGELACLSFLTKALEHRWGNSEAEMILQPGARVSRLYPAIFASYPVSRQRPGLYNPPETGA